MDITSLKQQATTIRDERERSANTATRVGRALLDTVTAVEENATAIATNKANIATNKANIATATADIAKFKAFYHGDLGNHASWVAAQARLDLMATDSSVNGQYQITVGNIPFIVNFALLNNTAKIFTQSIIGSAAIQSDGTLTTTHGIAVNIFSRTYASGKWGEWTRLAALSEVPVAQTDTNGTVGKYVYSYPTDPNRQVLSGNFKVICVSNGVEIQHRIWGAPEYTDEVTKKYKIPIVNPSQYGVMNKDVFKRVLYHTHYESGSTTTAVKIKYTNYETGGTNDLTITAASSAKAGVMTADQYNKYIEITNCFKGYIGQILSYDTTTKFKSALAGMPTNNTGKYGRFVAIVSNVKVFVSFVQLTSNSYAQWVEGPVMKGTDGDLYLNNELGVHLVGRVYANGAWGLWRSTILDDELPLPASSTNDGLMSKEDYDLLQNIKAQLKL